MHSHVNHGRGLESIEPLGGVTRRSAPEVRRRRQAIDWQELLVLSVRRTPRSTPLPSRVRGDFARSTSSRPVMRDTVMRDTVILSAGTLVRKSGFINASWEEIDLDGAVWTISKERMKAGLPHNVYLSRQACANLAFWPYPSRTQGRTAQVALPQRLDDRAIRRRGWRHDSLPFRFPACHAAQTDNSRHCTLEPT